MHAGVNGSSYQQASRDLAELGDLKVAPKPIERLVHRIGQERIDQRDAAVAAHASLPLMEKDAVADSNRTCPAVAMVSVDGGRLQVRTPSKSSEATPSKASETVEPTPSKASETVEPTPSKVSETMDPTPSKSSEPTAPEISEPKPPETSEPTRKSHWRESKVAVLETYISAVHEADPDPDVPRCFLDLKRTAELVRGVGHALPAGLEFAAKDGSGGSDESAATEQERATRPGRPERLVRSVLASRATGDDFGPMTHQAAWERNFFGAARRVFLGDGLAVNWSIHREHFSTFTAILDFVHALSYVFAAAFAGRSQAEGETIYKRWIQAVWTGRVTELLPELESRSAELGAPPARCADTDPRQLVFDACRYLRNNAERMRYDEYRRQGLPIMTSAVESVIKMINRRVKGSEKFWSEGGAEAILQLRADALSETEILPRFWSEREKQAKVARPYRQAA